MDAFRIIKWYKLSSLSLLHVKMDICLIYKNKATIFKINSKTDKVGLSVY